MDSPARPGASNPDLWWHSSRRYEITAPELIFSFVEVLGLQHLLRDPTSSESIESSSLDQTIWRAARVLRPTEFGGGVQPDFASPEWRSSKGQILQILSSIQQGTYNEGLNQHASNSSWTPVGGSERIASYHTPAETPGTGLARASSESRTASIKSNHTAEDLQYQGTDSAPFSPADSVTRSIRRRRSSSSMQNDKPGKRARGPQEHVCDVCQKRFPFLSKLKDHLKTHSTEKNLQCPYCRKSFKRNREVSAHLKSVHKMDQLQIHPLAPPSPAAPMYPSTPASMGQPPTPASLSMLPPTPGPSGSIGTLPPPRPSPRAHSAYPSAFTPIPTPEQLGAPTPDYSEPISADTPGFGPRIGAGHSDDLSRGVSNIHISSNRYDDSVELAPIRIPASLEPASAPDMSDTRTSDPPSPSDSSKGQTTVSPDREMTDRGTTPKMDPPATDPDDPLTPKNPDRPIDPPNPAEVTSPTKAASTPEPTSPAEPTNPAKSTNPADIGSPPKVNIKKEPTNSENAVKPDTVESPGSELSKHRESPHAASISSGESEVSNTSEKAKQLDSYNVHVLMGQYSGS